jgi:hypothetical protein
MNVRELVAELNHIWGTDKPEIICERLGYDKPESLVRRLTRNKYYAEASRLDRALRASLVNDDRRVS